MARSTRAFVSGALLAVAIATWLALRERRPAEAVAPESNNGRVAATDVEPSVDARIPIAAVIGANPAAGAPSLPAAAEIRGRFVDEYGAPIPAVELTLTAREANGGRTRAWSRPFEWNAVHGVSGDDGRFALRFDPPPPFMFELRARDATHESARWSWYEIELDEVVDLGDVALRNSGALHVLVLDGNGLPVAQGWRVRVDGPRGVRSQARERYWAIFDPSDGPGDFVVEGLSPGKCALELTLTSAPGNPVKRRVDVRAGEVTEVELRYDGPDSSRSITVTARLPRHALAVGFDLLGAAKLESSSGKRIEGKKSASRAHQVQYEDLEPGAYSLSIEHPAFARQDLEGLVAGSSVDVQLVGECELQVSVADAESDAALECYDLALRANGRTLTGVVHKAADSVPSGGIYEGIVAGDWTAIVAAPGYVTQELGVSALAAGETRYLEFVLQTGTRIAGRLVDADGSALGRRQTVVLYAPAEIDDGPSSPCLPMRSSGGDSKRQRHAVDERIAERDGSFAFTDVAPGRYILRTRLGIGVVAVHELQLHEGERIDGIELRVPQTASLSGRVLAPPDARLAGLALRVGPARADVRDAETLMSLELSRHPESRCAVAADGSYSIAHLEPGEQRVWLTLPTADLDRKWQSEATELELGSLVLAIGANVRDFDVRASFPGALEVLVLVDGLPGVDLVVDAVPASDSKHRYVATLSAATDERGVARIEHVPPGEWRVSVTTTEGEWTYELARPVVVAANARAVTEASFPLVEGDVAVLDATGAPLKAPRVSLLLGDGGYGRRYETRELDGQGRLHLRAPPGRMRIEESPANTSALLTVGAEKAAGSRPFAEFDWTPQGAVPSAVKLVRE